MAQAAQSGDESQLDAIAARVREPLRAFLATRTQSTADAEDLAQETLLRAFDRLHSYDPQRPFQTWLFSIGKNLAVNLHVADARRQSRQEVAIAEQDEVASVQTSANIGVWKHAREILSDESYLALYLRYHDEASVKDIAAELGRTVVSTKVLLYRARKRLLAEVSL